MAFQAFQSARTGSGSAAFRALAALVMAFAMTLLAQPSHAFAEGGDGSGGGGGADQPLALEEAYPNADNAYVAGEDLYLKFTKNVAAVADQNVALVHLQKADGTEVPATAYCKDADSESEYRQYIYVTPDEDLAAGDYLIVADAGIVAKNGMATSEPYTAAFTVDAPAVSADSSADKPAGNGASSQDQAEAQNQAQEESDMAPVVVMVAAIAAVVLVLVRKKK